MKIRTLLERIKKGTVDYRMRTQAYTHAHTFSNKSHLEKLELAYINIQELYTLTLPNKSNIHVAYLNTEKKNTIFI